MDNKILEMCKEIINTDVETLELEGFSCDKYNVDCYECPFWRENRNDGMNCYEDENANKTQEIAKKYIKDNENNKKESDNMNDKKMKLIDIFNNWDDFKVGTEFYSEGVEAPLMFKDEKGLTVFNKGGGVHFHLNKTMLIIKEPIEYIDFDDIEVGEEFMIEDRGRILDNTYLKVEVFGKVKVLEKGCNGSVFVVNNIDLSKSNEFKFVRK